MKLDDYDEDFWDAESMLTQALGRGVSPEEFLYLLSRFPYLVIADGSGSTPPNKIPVKSRCPKSNWLVYDYGERLVTHPGRLCFGSYRIGEDDDDEEGGGANANGVVQGIGTLVQQGVDSATHLIQLASDKWERVAILEGYYVLQRAAWLASKAIEFRTDYEPDLEDVRVYESLQALRSGSLYEKPSFRPEPS